MTEEQRERLLSDPAVYLLDDIDVCCMALIFHLSNNKEAKNSNIVQAILKGIGKITGHNKKHAERIKIILSIDNTAYTSASIAKPPAKR